MRATFTLLFLALTLISPGQFKARNVDASSGDSSVIFRDIINHITIEGIKDLSRYGVSMDGAVFTYLGFNRFLIKKVISDTVKINVFRGALKKQKIVYSQKFIVEEAGVPSVILKEESDETFSSGQIFNRTRLQVRIPNPHYTGECKVAHFEISVRDSQDKLVMPVTFISGNYLGKSIYNKINSLTSGAKMYFTQVILTYPDGDYEKYEDFILEKK